MIEILKIIAALACGYLLGSLNTAVIVGKIYGKDIRSHGSKNAGLTNTLRVFGKFAALLVLLGDILKGIIACYIGLLIGVHFYSGDAYDSISLLAAGAGAVIGHNWPLFFKFKGELCRKAICSAIKRSIFKVIWVIFHIKGSGLVIVMPIRVIFHTKSAHSRHSDTILDGFSHKCG